MTSGDDRISQAGKRRLRRGCIFFLVIFAIGFFAGLSAAKKALLGPRWMRTITGITLPAAPPSYPAPQNAPAASPGTRPPPGVNPPNTGSPASGSSDESGQNPADGSGQNPSPGAGGPAGPTGTTSGGAPGSAAPGSGSNGAAVLQSPPPGGWLVGEWEVTDEVHLPGAKPTSVTSDYIFEDGGTGEFDTNGKKWYDLHWEDANDYLLITFVTDTQDETNDKVKLKYSFSIDHSLLTLLPEGKPDPREKMYHLGAGVYKRK